MRKYINTLSSDLGWLSIVFAILFPLIAYPLAIVGLAVRKNLKTYRRDVWLNVIGLCLALIHGLLGLIWGLGLF